ncbi:MAG: hypothetical protein WCO00_12435 [Rhodospirillaceae bacterium]
MEMVVYTILAVVFYYLSDQAVERIEIRVGRRLPYRSVLFFGFLASLALVSFALIRQFE